MIEHCARRVRAGGGCAAGEFDRSFVDPSRSPARPPATCGARGSRRRGRLHPIARARVRGARARWWASRSRGGGERRHEGALAVTGRTVPWPALQLTTCEPTPVSMRGATRPRHLVGSPPVGGDVRVGWSRWSAGVKVVLQAPCDVGHFFVVWVRSRAVCRPGQVRSWWAICQSPTTTMRSRTRDRGSRRSSGRRPRGRPWRPSPSMTGPTPS